MGRIPGEILNRGFSATRKFSALPGLGGRRAEIRQSGLDVFDVLTCDAIYLRPSMIGMLRDANKHFVAVLKENRPDLLDEARRLLPGETPESPTLPKAPGKSSREVQLRQADAFTTSSIDIPFHCFLRNLQPALRQAHTSRVVLGGTCRARSPRDNASRNRRRKTTRTV